MLMAQIGRDKPEALAVRLQNRPDHVSHLKSSSEVQQAGPLLDSTGEMCGSLTVLEVTEMAEAEHWAAADPNGLFDSFELMPRNRVIG